MVSAAFKYVPRTAATTFAFSSVFILLQRDSAIFLLDFTDTDAEELGLGTG